MWKIELSGEAFDIETLRPLASTADATIAPGPDGRYCLSGSMFDSLTTAHEVRGHARAVLLRLNGLARYEHPKHRLVQPGIHVYEQSPSGGLTHHHVFVEGIEARTKVGTVAFVFGPPGEFDNPPSAEPAEFERRKRLLTEPALVKILEALACDEISWQRLRVAYEVLVDLVGGKGGKNSQCLIKHFATRDEILDFEQNVQDPRLGGVDAVHGVERPQAPLRRKMTQHEGLEFVRRLVTTFFCGRMLKRAEARGPAFALTAMSHALPPISRTGYRAALAD